MKKYSIYLCVVAVGIFLSGCSAQEKSEPIPGTAAQQEAGEASVINEPAEAPAEQIEPQDAAGLEDEEQDSIDENANMPVECGFTQEIIELLDHFNPPATKGETGTFEDFDKVLNSDFTGLWYDPEIGEAVWLKEDGAYVYIPYLSLYGNELYEWEVIDRKQRGKCPELAVYISGRDSGELAYYVGGITDDYFWCIGQGQILYRITGLSSND